MLQVGLVVSPPNEGHAVLRSPIPGFVKPPPDCQSVRSSHFLPMNSIPYGGSQMMLPSVPSPISFIFFGIPSFIIIFMLLISTILFTPFFIFSTYPDHHIFFFSTSMMSIIKKIRPRRCQLSVPASSKKKIEKAASIKVDGVILDLEDSVAPDQKESARHQIIDGLTQLNWRASSISVRINATNTEWCHQDIIELVSNCSEKIATLIVPMVNTSNDLLFVETLMNQLAIKHRRALEIGIEGLIETVEGLSNIDEIARSSDKLEALVLGMGDYAASQRMRINTIGDVSSEAGDIWQYPRYRLIVACHANGIHPIDGPYADIKDIAGLKLDTKKTSLIGMMGKWAIHPNQVELANDLFTPKETTLVLTLIAKSLLVPSPEPFPYHNFTPLI